VAGLPALVACDASCKARFCLGLHSNKVLLGEQLGSRPAAACVNQSSAGSNQLPRAACKLWCCLCLVAAGDELFYFILFVFTKIIVSNKFCKTNSQPPDETVERSYRRFILQALPL
jgi:hypothetical protein